MKKKIYEAPSLKVRKLRPVRILCASSTELTGGSESVGEESGYWDGGSYGGQTESVGEEDGAW